MELILIALALICGIYLAIGVVMLVIYAILEHRTRYYQSTFDLYLGYLKMAWYDIPVFITMWPGMRDVFMISLEDFRDWRKRYIQSTGHFWNR